MTGSPTEPRNTVRHEVRKTWSRPATTFFFFQVLERVGVCLFTRATTRFSSSVLSLMETPSLDASSDQASRGLYLRQEGAATRLSASHEIRCECFFFSVFHLSRPLLWPTLSHKNLHPSRISLVLASSVSLRQRTQFLVSRVTSRPGLLPSLFLER